MVNCVFLIILSLGEIINCFHSKISCLDLQYLNSQTNVLLATNCVVPPVCSLKTLFMYITNFDMLLISAFSIYYYYYYFLLRRAFSIFTFTLLTPKVNVYCLMSIFNFAINDPHAYKLKRKRKVKIHQV